jgi:hypothetical protein
MVELTANNYDPNQRLSTLNLSARHKRIKLQTDQVLSLQRREEIPDRERISSGDAVNKTSKWCNVVFTLAKSARNQRGNRGVCQRVEPNPRRPEPARKHRSNPCNNLPGLM